MLLRQLFEAKATEVAIIFGRFNPPHFGHVDAWREAAKFPNWYVGTNQSTQGPKDPLPYNIKIEAMKTMYPEIEDHLVAEQSWFTLAAMVYKQYGENTILKIVTDPQDKDVYVPMIQKQNGIEGPHGYYKFAGIEWHKADRKSEASLVRKAVKENNPQDFEKYSGVPADTQVAGVNYFDLVRKYMLPYMEAEEEKLRKQQERNRLKADKDKLKTEKPSTKKKGATDLSIRRAAAKPVNTDAEVSERITFDPVTGQKNPSFADQMKAQGAPSAPAQGGSTQPLSSRYGPGYEGSPAPYTIIVNGKEYKFAGREKQGPGTGEIIKVPGGAIGIRGLAPVNVEIGTDGFFYVVPRTESLSDTSLREFSPVGSGNDKPPRGPNISGRDPWDSGDSGEDPYSRPKPEYYSRSIDYFGQFEADHFDKEIFNKKTGVFKGYWENDDGSFVQIAYFKFDDPKQAARDFDDSPGMGWYYEPENESLAEYGDTAKGQKMLTKVQKRAVDRVVSKKADTDPKYAKKNKDTADRAWDRMSDKDVSEEKQKGVDGKACWDGYKRIGTKQKGGKTVDNCVKVGESNSKVMAQTAKRLSDPKDGSVAKIRAAGDKRREDQLKSRDIAKKNEHFDFKSSLQELSNDMLGRYKKAASADASRADKKGNFKQGDKRFNGIVKATKKQFDNDTKGNK